MNFDARKAKQMPPGESMTLDGYPGLRLEATATTRTWLYRYKSPVDGLMRRIKIGQWPAMSAHAAIVAWEELRARRNRGDDPAAQARAIRIKAKAEAERTRQAEMTAAYTVKRLCDEYWEGHIRPHRAKKGATEIRRLFDKELIPIQDLPATAITRAQAFDFLKGLADAKPVIAGQLRAELGAAWDYAIDAGRIPEETPNWWRHIMRGKIRSKGKKISGKNIGTAKRFLSEQEIEELLRWLPNLSQLLQDTLTLYLWTCCRGAEIVSMEGTEIRNEQTGLWWVIPKAKTKNARHENAADLRVPLFGRALAIVMRRKDRYGDGYLFPKRGNLKEHIEQKTIQSSLFAYQPYSEVQPHKYPIRLPVTHWAPHDLRRTSRTLLASMGCRTEIAEVILGHMLPGVEGVYNQYKYDQERQDWLKRLSDKLEALAAID